MTSTPAATRARSGSTGAVSPATIQLRVRRGRHDPRRGRRAQAAVDDDADRAGVPARQAHREHRIVREHRADPDHDGVVMGLREDARAFEITREIIRAGAASARSTFVRRPGEFEHDGRGGPRSRAIHGCGGRGRPRRPARRRPRFRRLKACEALAMGERRRIRRPDHEPPQAARDDQIGAGRAIIAVGTCGARLEGHVERCAAGGFARLFQRKPLGGVGRRPA